MHQYGLSIKWMESRFAEKDWRFWWTSWTQVSWAHKYRRDKGTLKQVQQRHTKMIKGLEHLSDNDRLSEFRLFRLEERKLEGGE